MPTNQYDKGDGVRLHAEFKSNAAYADPTSVYLYIQDPDEVESTHQYTVTGTVSKSAVGKYYYDLEITKSGMWYYKYEGIGNVNQVAEAAFIVRRSEFP